MCMRVLSLCMCVCTAHACTHNAQKNQERMSNPLELESKLVLRIWDSAPGSSRKADLSLF